MKASLFEDEYENPFKSTNADTMSYQLIVDSWSEPFFMRRKVISEDFYLRTPMSLIITGARGTGKTMMFKYYSFQAQALLAEKKGSRILEYFKDSKSVSMYLKFDPYILQAFQGNNTGQSLFTHFFELVVCESYIELIELLLEKNEISIDTYQCIENGIFTLLGVDSRDKKMSIVVEDKINEVYEFINNIKMEEGEFRTGRIYQFKKLSYKIKELLCNKIVELKNIIFLWVIDEGENFLKCEQKTLNSFIKTLNARMNRDIFLRLGTRRPELATYETITEEEFLTIGRDYENKDINYYTIDSDEREDYKKWLIEIARKRLESNVIFSRKGLIKIQEFLGNKENQCEEAYSWAANCREHFKWCLKEQYNDEIYEALKIEDNPLKEMMNILWYKKDYCIEQIQLASRHPERASSTEEKELVKKYKDSFIDNKMAFLYFLAAKYKKQKQYYSFNTYSYLSVGNVCNFIKLCREAFDNAYFENKEELFSGKISIKAQHTAAISVAYDEIEKVKYVPILGKQLYALVINLGNLFNEYHSDVEMKNIEVNQFSVIYKSEEVDRIIKTALTWGVFLKKNELQTLDSTGNKGTIYTLNKMFCPLFGISYRSKGRYREILDEEIFIKLLEIQRKKVSSVIAVREEGNQQVTGQISLFDFQE